MGNTTISINKPLGTLFETPLRFYLNRKKFSDVYDIHIFLGFSSIYGALATNKNIWYCLTPNRMLYDLRDLKVGNGNLLARLVFYIYTNIFQLVDPLTVKNSFKKIIAQTQTIRERIKKYYSIANAPVIYPSFDPKGFNYSSFGDYYLSVSRLHEEKRVDLIAQSFTEMSDKNLLIIGDGPEKAKILEIIKGHDNITYKQNCTDEELHKLYANCLATIYIPMDEDYGLIPLESMASGKPCIGANEGGLRETIIQGKTGLLIKADKESLKKAVNALTKEKAQQMKYDCLQRVKKFGLQTFIKQWKEVIHDLR